jgi:hypothetical protein
LDKPTGSEAEWEHGEAGYPSDIRRIFSRFHRHDFILKIGKKKEKTTVKGQKVNKVAF